MDKWMAQHIKVDTTTQTQLQQNLDESDTTWSYDSAYARDCMALYIAQIDQPIDFGDNVFNEQFIQKKIQPPI